MKLKIKNEFMGLIITRKTKIGDVTLDTLIVNGDNLKAFMDDFSDVIEIEEFVHESEPSINNEQEKKRKDDLDAHIKYSLDKRDTELEKSLKDLSEGSLVGVTDPVNNKGEKFSDLLKVETEKLFQSLWNKDDEEWEKFLYEHKIKEYKEKFNSGRREGLDYSPGSETDRRLCDYFKRRNDKIL